MPRSILSNAATGLVVLVGLSSAAALFAASSPPERAREGRAGDDLRQAVRDFAESIEQAARMIAENHVKEFRPADLIVWAVEGLYEQAGERVPDSVAERLRAVPESRQERVSLLLDARQRLGRRSELLDHLDIDAAVGAVLRRVEPWAKRPQRESRDDNWATVFDQRWPARGIGLKLRQDAAGGPVRVFTPIKDGPAHLAGVLSGDVITRIRNHGRFEADEIDTNGLTVEDVHRHLARRPGTRVTLTVRREGYEQPLEVSTWRPRDEVEEETVFGHQRGLDNSWNFLLDSEKRIGYLRIGGLSLHTERDVRRALEQLTRDRLGDELQGLILDLRLSQGIYLDTAVNLAELFVGPELILKVRGRNRQTEFRGERPAGYGRFPVVCVINRDSAPTLEVLAACLQDQRRALVLGDRSRGDACVRSVYRLPAGGRIELTTAVFERPSGKNLSKILTAGRDDEDWGVIPDRLVRLSARLDAELREHLQRLEVIPRPDRPAPAPQFRDLQLELAVAYLKRLSEGP